jgi:hypothetical protein
MNARPFHRLASGSTIASAIGPSILASIFALALSGATLPARAADEWPPRTPPRGPTDPQAPSVAPLSTVPAIQPEADDDARSATRETEPASEPVAASSGDVESVRVVASPPRRESAPRAGLTGNRLFLRTPGNEVVLFPGVLVQVDGRSFQTEDLAVPDTSLWLRRARPELAGWLGPVVYFNAAADFASGASLRGVDDFVAVAPRADRAILQVGQFDAPFMLENQTRDRDLDFMERSVAVRAFAIPQNKKRGAMVQGTNPDRNYYYAAGGFVGDGESDVMARGWAAPFSFTDPDVLRDITLGGSAWLGSASASASMPDQTTAGGVVLLDPATTWLDGTDATAVALRPRGRVDAVALELNAPFRHRAGVRFEWVAKHEALAEVSTLNAGAATTRPGFALGGWSTYGEAWCWILGSDRGTGAPGLELPVRLAPPFGLERQLTALMVAARFEYLDESVTAPADGMPTADVWSIGKTTVTTARVAANAWLGERVRLTLEYAWNRLGGTTLYSTSYTDPNIQELSLRMSLAL